MSRKRRKDGKSTDYIRQGKGVFKKKLNGNIRLWREWSYSKESIRLNTQGMKAALKGIQVGDKVRPAALGYRHGQHINHHQVGDARRHRRELFGVFFNIDINGQVSQLAERGVGRRQADHL